MSLRCPYKRGPCFPGRWHSTVSAQPSSGPQPRVHSLISSRIAVTLGSSQPTSAGSCRAEALGLEDTPSSLLSCCPLSGEMFLAVKKPIHRACLASTSLGVPQLSSGAALWWHQEVSPWRNSLSLWDLILPPSGKFTCALASASPHRGPGPGTGGLHGRG